MKGHKSKAWIPARKTNSVAQVRNFSGSDQHGNIGGRAQHIS